MHQNKNVLDWTMLFNFVQLTYRPEWADHHLVAPWDSKGRKR